MVLLPWPKLPHRQVCIGKIKYACPKGLVRIQIEDHRRADQDARSSRVFEVDPGLNLKIVVPVPFFIQWAAECVQAPELASMDESLSKGVNGKEK